MKLNQIIELIEKGFFYQLQGRCHSIKWQKHGLTHFQLIVFFQLPHDFVFTPYHVDNLISAEIPPYGTALHSIIKRCNIHGPGGTTNPHSPCMKSGKCSKHFPKGFQLATTIGEDAYPNYRRRSLEDGGRFYTTLIRGQEIRITNENVVPYNPMLSVLMDSHINIEFCASIKAIQYLFKYQLKGSDQATISIVAGDDSEQDEVATFMSKRYVSSMENISIPHSSSQTSNNTSTYSSGKSATHFV